MYERKVKILKEIYNELETIRLSGACNMLNLPCISGIVNQSPDFFPHLYAFINSKSLKRRQREELYALMLLTWDLQQKSESELFEMIVSENYPENLRKMLDLMSDEFLDEAERIAELL